MLFLAALIGKNHVYVPIGCCFIALDVANSKTDIPKNNSGNSDEAMCKVLPFIQFQFDVLFKLAALQ